MCQVNGETFSPKLEPQIIHGKACVKCEKDSVIVVGTNGTFCKDCFEVYFSHKFRASMGRNPLVRHHDKVALAYSGGNNSSALLNLIKKGLDPATVKKLKFTPGLIFVDERILYPSDDYEKVKEIEEIMRNTGFPYHIVKLEEVFSTEDTDEKMTNAEKLEKLFNSITTLTSKQETLYRLRCYLLSRKAKELGYDHVFMGETSTRLAINILSNFSLGRGVHLPQDTGFSDGLRFEGVGVKLLRPMREMSMKEIAVYNALNKVPTVFLPNLATSQSVTSSVQNLTENFILGLVAGFPSTEMTVFRTSNKLHGKNDEKKSRGCCRLCFGAIDTECGTAQATALRHTLFSEAINTSHASSTYNDSSINIMDVPTLIQPLEYQNLQVCYACRLLGKEVTQDGKDILFPPVVTMTTYPEKLLSSNDIKNKLNGILLED
uniref:cytoplasmic tRNA 2-thiolation protein 2-like n=1 Tax=Ciona intestinalis TaxID=7719 RepID=UPI00006A59F2|nr:cytoplasmic tRNA 2-thiolation protein 2-like [Ciona intestinalis]|eukprot:XP_018668608.1 cytoplasmic tRNA 2-thiolation protein 2-like [Ciona intestinalis]